MTITPPRELVQQWENEALELWVASDAPTATHIAARAAQWGADQELEACIAFVRRGPWCSEKLRAARRPKPLSLKERALDDLKTMTTLPPGMSPLAPETVERIERIRRALEALPDDRT